MQSTLSRLAITLLLTVLPIHAELLQLDLTIFGMD